MSRKVKETIYYIGADDHDIDFFEGHFIVPEGMAYNSYLIADEKTCVMDTIDKSKTDEWLGKIREILGDKSPDYLVVQHMEPDHSASIEAFLAAYPEATVVANGKAFKMIEQFFPGLNIANKIEVTAETALSLGSRELAFVQAPMVHWPEVMMTYDPKEKVLFSADGFGKFGALDMCGETGADDDDWACEARRYFFGIIGKYGPQVKQVLAKAAELDIQAILPLHGPALLENLDYYLGQYSTWASYEPEDKGVAICYTSVYGNTKAAVELLAEELKKAGEEIVEVSDLARCDMPEAVEDAFRYDRLVLATTTYNAEIFPFMREFIDMLTERNYQNRTIAMIENGSWAPNAISTMKKKLEGSKNITYTDNNVTILSSMTEQNKAEIAALAKELAEGRKDTAAEEKPAETKKWRCKMCGYEYEGDELPEGFTCPLCKRPAEDFELVE